MLRLASDADVHGDIVRGLRRRRPEIDLVRAQDALPEGTSDPAVLAWAAGEKCVDRFLLIGRQRTGSSSPTTGTRWSDSRTSGWRRETRCRA